jgi:hypothetical protein
MTEKRGNPRDPTDMSHPDYDPAADPIHPFFEGNKTDGKQTADQSSENAYKVGPGFPPNEHKWKKGCPSPYPKGRPRKGFLTSTPSGLFEPKRCRATRCRTTTATITKGSR